MVNIAICTIVKIYQSYCYVAYELKSADTIDNSTLIKVANVYKKICASINKIDSENTTEENFYYVVDELPLMDGLYTEILEQLTGLLCEKSVLRIPLTNEFYENSILEQLILNTDEIPIENIYTSKY